MAQRTDYRHVINCLEQLASQQSEVVLSTKKLAALLAATGTVNAHRAETIIRSVSQIPGSFLKTTGFGRRGGNIKFVKPEERQNNETQREAIRKLAERIQQLEAREKELEKERDEAADKKPQDRIVAIQLKNGKRNGKKIEGIFHAQFEKICKLIKARKNIFIYGPTGCGKSHICSQAASVMGLRFAFVSCTSGMSEGVLGGRLLPTGNQGTFEYVISEFIDCYENGGVFLLDEMDAADPNVLLLVNAALANGRVAVPNRPDNPYAKRHKDFVCIAAANTVGTGADRLYSGRNKLDAATLDRFAIGKVFMDYDPDVEKQLCPDDELRSRLLRYREAIRAHRLERAVSTRFMIDAYEMKHEFDFTDEDIDQAFFSGWREDEVTKVKNHV